jgi:Reverse transcriptase (RNA-dependent DNA polymerase)
LNSRTFGEIAILKIGKRLTKLDDRGIVCTFVGYSDEHPTNTYRFVNLTTNKVMMCRDVFWLQKSWEEYKGLAHTNITHGSVFDHDDDDYDANEFEHNDTIENDNLNVNAIMNDAIANENDGFSDDDETVEPIQEREGSTRLEREMRRIHTNYNTTIPNENDAADLALMSATTSEYMEPERFSEAWDHPNPDSRSKWREAISKEFQDMKNKRVWKYCKKTDIPKDRKLIGSKWVFKLKKNGTHRARLVALGYSQVPRVDYTENFAPEISDATFRII